MRVLDHVIVAESGYCSLRELGAFADAEAESPGGGRWDAAARKRPGPKGAGVPGR